MGDTPYEYEEDMWSRTCALLAAYDVGDFYVHFQVADTLLKGKVTLKQLENYFNNNAWSKYKYANDLEEHTGGGDGDEDREIPREHAPRKSKARSGRPSTRTLNQFRRSKVYKLLHSVYVFSSSCIVAMTSLRLTQGISR